MALCVGATVLLQREGFFRSASEFLQASLAATWGLGAFAAVLWTSVLIVAVIAGISLIGGMAIYYSSSARSYMGYVWRGALVLVVAVVLCVVAFKIVSVI